MNLYLRFLFIFFKTLFTKKQAIFAESRLKFRVLPFDCDINMHLTNSRYLSFMDLGRWHLMGQSKLLKHIYQNRWIPVVGAIEISFIRALNPLQQFELISKVIGWDKNYIYVEQRFKTKKGIAALAIIKGTLVINGRKCDMQKVLEKIQPGAASPELPEAIEHWKYLTDAKKSYTS